MSNATNFHMQSELALAAYAQNLFQGIEVGEYEDSLLNAGMSTLQASQFASTWHVVDQFTDPSSGASATIFQKGLEFSVAIRGTELEAGDLIADGLLALGVSSRLNPQFAALQTKMNEWREEGGPLHDQFFSVTGHSLGGYLAVAVKETYSDHVTEAYLYNAPGSGGLIGNIGDLVSGIFSESTPGANGIWNIKASEGISFITELGAQPSAGIPAQIEADPGIGFGNHSIVRLTDALAIQAVYAGLVPGLTSAQINALVDATGNPMNQTLESTLDALRRLLLGSGVDATPTEDRNALYANLHDLTASGEYQELAAMTTAQLTVLAGTPAPTIASSAGNVDAQGLAVRYALKELNSFALTEADYSAPNADGALNLYDANTQRNGLTAQYLADRANFLERKLWFSTEDKNPVDPSNSSYDPEQPPSFINELTSNFFLDKESGYDIRIGALFPSTHVYAFGSEKTDILIGQSLDDHLYGGAGNDILVGGLGDGDYLEGGVGMDLYQFKSGDGTDTVLEADGRGLLVRNGAALALGVKVSLDVWELGGTTYTRIGTDLEITFQDNATDKITVRDFDFLAAQAGGHLGIRLIQPGAVPEVTNVLTGDRTLTDADPQAEGVQVGYDAWGNELTQEPEAQRADALYGHDGESDLIQGGAGDDVIFGDTEQLAQPGPRTNPQSSAIGEADQIEAGAGRDIVTAGGGDDWVEGGADGDILGGNDGNDTIYASTSNGQALTIGQAISNGETEEATAGLQDLLSGDADDDILISSSGSDYLAGGEGADLLIGGAGDDTIYGDRAVTGATLGWATSRVVDEVDDVVTYTVVASGMTGTEAEGGADVIYAGAGDDWVFAGGGDDHVEAGSGLNVVLGEAGDDILVGGADRDVLDGDSAPSNAAGTYGDDYVDGAGGDDTLFGGKGNDVLIGGAGQDQLIGGDHDDVLYGGTETDVLQGGAGKDSYLYFRGDGEDIVIDPDITTGSQYRSSLVLGPDITRDQVKFRLGSLMIDLGEGDAIHFQGFDAEDPLATPVLDSIQFADGEFMTYEDILAQGFDIDGTEAIDVLFGTPYTDRIDAKGGDDTVIGRAGDDSILGGTGDDWLEGNEGDDIIDGGEGGDELSGGWGDDTLSGGEGDDALAGEGGNDTLEGGAGNDSLAGHDGDEVLNGGTGDDLLLGNDGSDTYLFSAGDGLDLVDEQALIAQGVADEAGIDVVRFDASVTPAQVALLRGANGDLTIRYGTTDAVTIIGQYTGAAQAVERIEFDDGTFIDKAALEALATAPIEGTGGDDTLTGTPGNDTLEGGAGADSYAVYLGMGRDTIVDASPSAEIGTLQLAAGLTLDGLKARQAGEDLAVDIRGTSDGVLLQGYFATGSTQTWQIAENGGTVTAIQDLIDRPDPYADDVALGAREDFRQGLLSAWETETLSPVLPTHAQVFESWSQTTFTFLGDGVLQPYTEVQPPVTSLSINGYGVRAGAYFSDAPLVHHSIDVLATSQASDDPTITAQSQAQSSTQNLTYGVTPGNVIPGYGSQSSSGTSTFASGANAFNTIVSRTTQGWAPIALTPGSGAGFPGTLNIQEIAELRTLEDINGGESSNIIHGAGGISAGHVALIDAGDGHDEVYAGPDDFVYGNEGHDYLSGGRLVYGGNGDDQLDGGLNQYGGAGEDELYGGVFMAGGSGDDQMTGVEGATTFYIDPAELGADVIQDLDGVSIDELTEWYYEAIGIEQGPFGLPGDLGGLWGAAGQTQGRLNNELYYDAEEYPGYESAAITGSLPEALNFFYLSLDDLRADLAVIGKPYQPEDVRFLVSLEGLTANDYRALEPFYAGLLEKDTVEFGPGVTPGELTLTWNTVEVEDPVSGEDVPHAALELSWGANNSVSIAIPRALDPIGTGVEQFRFADGTVLSMAEIIALAPPAPSFDPAIPVDGTSSDDAMAGTRASELFSGFEGADAIDADEGDDVLVGGDGADALDGEEGGDQYVYEANEVGIDRLTDSGTSAQAYLDWYYSGQGLENWKHRPEYAYPGKYRIYLGIDSGYRYYDTFEEAAAAGVVEGNPPVSLVAPATLVAPLVRRDDSATLEQLIEAGALERDVVSFGAGISFGDLQLTVTVPGAVAEDHPEQPWYGGGTLSVRWAGGGAGFDVEVPDVSYGFTGTSLIGDWGSYRLGEGIETFQFAGGPTYTLEEILQQAIVVPTYDYVVARGSGAHELDVASYNGIRFESDISSSEILIERDNLDLLVTLTDFSASVQVAGWFAAPPGVPNVSLRFTSDPTISPWEITQTLLTQHGTPFFDSLEAVDGFPNSLYGEGGNDSLEGGTGDDTLDGGVGNDFLQGGAGDDVYLFGSGSGQDNVSEDEDDGGAGFDAIRFSNGVAPADVTVERDYGNLVLTLDGAVDSIRVSGWFTESGGSVERIEFSDGTVWNATVIESMLPPADAPTNDSDAVNGLTGNDLLSGLGGDDEIYGYAGNDTLQGGGGFDYLVGGKGDDTYLFSPGDGIDEIEEGGGQDRILFGPGIAPGEVVLTRDQYSLFIAVGAAGETVTVWDWLYEPASRVEQIEFADGTIWNEAEIWSRFAPTVATEGDDVLLGTNQDDVLDGLGGNDELWGYEGNDILSGGDGDDYVEGGGGSNLLEGGVGADGLGLEGFAGSNLFIGGAGDDEFGTDAGPSVVAFNAGDGFDTVNADAGARLTISLGGLAEAGIELSRAFNTVYVEFATGDVLRLEGFGLNPQWPEAKLQIIGADIRTYDLDALIRDFDAAQDGGPENWSIAAALQDRLLSVSTTHAVGGAIAVQYATTGSTGALSTADKQAVLNDANFGLAAQSIAAGSANQPPAVDSPIADQNASEDAGFSFAVPADAFSDPDGGDELTYTASLGDGSALPAWLSFDAETRTFSGIPLQANVGAIEVKVTATDGEGLAADDTFTLTVANVNDAPVVTPAAATQTLLLDQSADAASLFSATDEDGDAPAQYEFWDSTAGNGHFAVNGVDQEVNVAIVVSAADLANTDFVGADEAGSDLVWVRVSDGQSFGAWKSWTMNSWPHATNAAPVADAPDGAVLRDQAVLAQTLFSASDADADTIAQYEFWDDTAGGGYFALDGVAQANNPISVTAAQLADLEYVGGANPGTEQVWVRANDGLEWGAWESWNMTTALHIPNAAPEATPAAATQTVLLGQSVAASGLFTAIDADGDPIARYEFFDSTAGNGHFTIGGVEQGVNLSIAVAVEDLAGVQFAGASGAGSDLVWVRVSDGQDFGAWKSWTMNSWPHLTNAAPVAQAPNETLLTSEVVAAGTLFSVTDADGDAAVRYEFWDDVAGGGFWRVNGVQQAAAASIAVDAANLADAEYVGGANPGSEQVWVRVNDGLQWGAWKAWLMTTALHDPNAAPVVTAANATVLLGQSAEAASLFAVTDADADTITQYEFFDSTAGNGHFAVDGVERGVNVSIGVSAAQLADTEFVGAASTGSDLVWVRAYDSMNWSDWKSWSMNSWPHLTNAAPVVTAANAGILGNEALSASMFFGVTDADGDAPAAYEFWDDVNGGGHWALDGVQQASGQAIAVDAADLANVDYIGGANPGTEQVWVRASDGMGWSPWKNWLMSTEGGMLRGGEGPDTLIGEAGPTVLEGGAGDDTLTDTDGDNLLSGGEGDDTMTGGDGHDLFAGGTGNDTIDTGGGNNIIAYNSGGGIDTVFAGAGAANTLSFGGGIGYDDLNLSKDGNDLIVSAGENDRVVLKDWYAGSESVLNLQIILDATDEFDANSSDPLYNRKVQTFDFAGMVAEFDEALAQSPGLTSWAVTNALLAFHLSGADDAAIGGDLAYWYGRNNGFTGISLAAAQAAIGAPGFGADAQTLHPFSGLQEGLVKLS